MEIKITAPNLKISDRFEEYVTERLNKAILQSGSVQEIQVKITKQKDSSSRESLSHRVEITVVGKGPMIRAEAEASDKFSAFDISLGRLLERVRRAKDRRRNSRNPKRNPLGAGEVASSGFRELDITPVDLAILNGEAPTGAIDTVTPAEEEEYSPVVIRRKQFPATPITVDQALYEIELVGHDFYLFIDAETDRPSVLYRRKGWDYGVISLDSALD